MAAVAVGLFAVAGCGGDDGGSDASDPAGICADINQVVDPMVADFNSALMEVGSAAAREDEAALAEASGRLSDLVAQIVAAIREGAERTSDEEFGQALEAYAAALEGLLEQAAGPQPDLTQIGAAAERVAAICNPSSPGPSEAPGPNEQ